MFPKRTERKPIGDRSSSRRCLARGPRRHHPRADRRCLDCDDDGGWNCERANGSVRSSFATSINVLVGLLDSSKPREVRVHHAETVSCVARCSNGLERAKTLASHNASRAGKSAYEWCTTRPSTSTSSSAWAAAIPQNSVRNQLKDEVARSVKQRLLVGEFEAFCVQSPSGLSVEHRQDAANVGAVLPGCSFR